MKKGIKIIFLIQVLILSCKEKNTVLKDKLSKKNIAITKTEAKAFDVKEYATLILENKVNPSDDDETFECIKQLYSKETIDLEFYFNTFKIIVKKSDGSLAASIGLEIMNFIKYNPDFFLTAYAKFNLEEKERFISYLAFEFYFMAPEHFEGIDSYFAAVILKIKYSTEAKIKYLNAIKELTIIATEKNVND